MAAIVGADLSIFTIFGLQTLHTLKVLSVAFLTVLATAVIATTRFAGVTFTDFAGLTLRVCFASTTTPFPTNLTTWTRLLIATHGILATPVFADFTVLTSRVILTTSHTSTFCTNLAGLAIFVAIAIGVDTLARLANLAARAIFVLVACGLFGLAHTFGTRLTLFAIFVFLAIGVDTFALFAHLTVFAFAGRLAGSGAYTLIVFAGFPVGALAVSRTAPAIFGAVTLSVAAICGLSAEILVALQTIFTISGNGAFFAQASPTATSDSKRRHGQQTQHQNPKPRTKNRGRHTTS